MSSHTDFDEDQSRRKYQAPYTSNHPIPTVQKYRIELGERAERQKQTEEAQLEEADDSKAKQAYHAAKGVLTGDGAAKSKHDPYRTQNRNTNESSEAVQGTEARNGLKAESADTRTEDAKGDKQEKSATELAAGHSDPRQKRKDMKHKTRGQGGREVTDPVTHLPVIIYDSTSKDLKSAPENEPVFGSTPRTSTGLSGATKSQEQLDAEQSELQRSHHGMVKLFPPPNFDDLRQELKRTCELALAVGLGAIVALVSLALLTIQVFDIRLRGGQHLERSWTTKSSGSPLWTVIPTAAVLLVLGGTGAVVVIGVRGWLGKKVEELWDDEVWDAARADEQKISDAEDIAPESVAWLNNLLASVWPLINPDLFTSISDMLEDVMQASLPKVVRMVSIDDLGQGSEAFRILGINWLPSGAASQSVGEDGKLKRTGGKATGSKNTKDEQEVEDDDSGEQRTPPNGADGAEGGQKEENQEALAGMEAEQGDFVNMELAFAYRARSSGKSLQAKAKNAHLYLKFYLPGGIAVPVWVELRGIIGTMRLRLQLTPDPPFFSLCTLTFMGQPQADLSCVPLSRHALNLMDVPLISSFVQSSIDAALAEYVAPKSLTLDLKDMMMGDDFKKDTNTRGVVIICIKSAKDFKEGDGGIGPFRGSSDAYMTVSWGKFGKPVCSTRIIVDDQNPCWNEWCNILVTPEELNANERLRLQLWDSDKFTADDDLGRVEVDLHELMRDEKTQNKMCDREDRFVGEEPDEKMPGTLQWSVGCFTKTRITEQQLKMQTADSSIKSIEDLKQQVSEGAERKLREATAHDEGRELKQQKQQDYKEREDALIISAPPPRDHPSGIFSIQIHNITGLEVQSLQRHDRRHDQGDREDDAEHGEDLPSSYATIILNHQKIYRTRTKPKNARPFFNAGTERFVADWQSAEVMISVRDDREREDDALLGMIYLPLRRVFETRSQVMESYPLVGGMGYGRARISMVWRSVDVSLPKELRGWNYGTLEVQCPVRAKSIAEASTGGESFAQCRLKLRTNLMRVKMAASPSPPDGAPAEWRPKRDKQSTFLALRKRYSAPLVVEFRKSTLGPDKTPAFGVFWPQEIADEEERTVTVPVWKGGKDALHRATTSYGYRGLEDGEQALGEIELTLKFWRGLSGYHKSYASGGRHTDVRNVMEVLDTANDEGQVSSDDDDDDADATGDSDGDGDSDSTSTSANGSPGRRKLLRTHANQDSSASSSDDEASTSRAAKVPNPASTGAKLLSKLAGVDGNNDADDGARGARAQVRDYKAHHRTLHRKHRGIMQWKTARSLDWAAGKARRAGARVGGVFEHDDEKGRGIETEV